MNKKEKKSTTPGEEETIDEMNDFSEETKKNRFHKKKDKVYVVHRMKEKAQKVDEEADAEKRKKIDEEARKNKNNSQQ